jgi:hypothetical protein
MLEDSGLELEAFHRGAVSTEVASLHQSQPRRQRVLLSIATTDAEIFLSMSTGPPSAREGRDIPALSCVYLRLLDVFA